MVALGYSLVVGWCGSRLHLSGASGTQWLGCGLALDTMRCRGGWAARQRVTCLFDSGKRGGELV